MLSWSRLLGIACAFHLLAFAEPVSTDLLVERYSLLRNGDRVGYSEIRRTPDRSWVQECGRVELAKSKFVVEIDTHISRTSAGEVEVLARSALNGRWEEVYLLIDGERTRRVLRRGLEVHRSQLELGASSHVLSLSSPLDQAPMMRGALASWWAMPLIPKDDRLDVKGIPLDSTHPVPVLVERRESRRARFQGSDIKATRLFFHTPAQGRTVWVDEAGEHLLAMSNLALGIGAVLEGFEVPESSAAPLPSGLIEEEAELRLPDVVSSGTITLPTNQSVAAPGIVFVAGSGAVDRDGNAGVIGNDILRTLAHRLGQAGFATLRYDKRGVGRSRLAKEEEGSLEFEALARDAAAWVDYLRVRPEIDSSCIFLLGHSEGGYVASELAAKRDDLAGIALLAAPSSEMDQLLRLQLRLVLHAHGATHDEVAQAERAQEAFLRILAHGNLDQSRRLGMRDASGRWLAGHLQRSAEASYRQVTEPTLALYMDKDIQVPPSEAEKLAEYVGPALSLHIIEGLDHLMMAVPTRPGMGWYADPDRILAYEIDRKTIEWLTRQPCYPDT